jgi:predicted DNA-binding antitoxin AbrB/MazE fold protein
MEGVEWIYDNGILKPQEIEQIETEIKRTPKAQLAEAQVRVFQNFLSKL